MTVRKYILCSIAVLLLSIAQALTAFSEELCELPEIRVDQRPGYGGPPIVVKIGIFVADITSVDDVAQTMSGDFMVLLEWQDERLAEQAGCRFPISKIWNPQLEMLNSAELRKFYNFQRDQARVEDGGRIIYYQRNVGSLSTYHHLSQFPFDKQKFQIRVVSAFYSPEDVVLEANTALTKISDLINIADWTINPPNVSVEDVEMFDLGIQRSVFTLEIPASRNSEFYIWKILVPLTLIVMMSWVVFWINPVKFGPQLGLSATAMLTLIAFQFAQTGVLPRLSYFTIMDKLILGASLLVFLSFFESAAAIYLVSKGMEKAAVMMDVVCRWIFPLIFLFYWTSVIYF